MRILVVKKSLSARFGVSPLVKSQQFGHTRHCKDAMSNE
jgi:hypothetical protein